MHRLIHENLHHLQHHRHKPRDRPCILHYVCRMEDWAKLISLNCFFLLKSDTVNTTGGSLYWYCGQTAVEGDRDGSWLSSFFNCFSSFATRRCWCVATSSCVSIWLRGSFTVQPALLKGHSILCRGHSLICALSCFLLSPLILHLFGHFTGNSWHTGRCCSITISHESW